MSRKITNVMAIMAVLALTAGVAKAQNLVWKINPAASVAQLSIQQTFIPASLSSGNGDLHIDIVNQSGPPSAGWNDGNAGPLTGTFVTNYVEGSSVQFVNADPRTNIQGVNHVTAVHPTGFTPNAALWDPNAPNGDGGFGAYVAVAPQAPAMWANNAFIEEFAAYASSNAFTNTHFALDSASPVASAPAGYNQEVFNPSGSNFGLSQTDFLLHSYIPSLVTDSLTIAADPNANPDSKSPPPTFIGNNQSVSILSAPAVITANGNTRTMTLPFAIAPIIFYVGDVPFGGALIGQIVATTTVPEPSTMMMAGLGLVSLGFVARKKFRKA
jgi:hypothetical protein